MRWIGTAYLIYASWKIFGVFPVSFNQKHERNWSVKILTVLISDSHATSVFSQPWPQQYALHDTTDQLHIRILILLWEELPFIIWNAKNATLPFKLKKSTFNHRSDQVASADLLGLYSSSPTHFFIADTNLKFLILHHIIAVTSLNAFYI